MLEPVTLEGRIVRLEPLTMGHLDGLCRFGLDPELWKWTLTVIRTREELRDYLQIAVDEREAGKSLPFTVIERASGAVVGSTRFANIDLPQKRLEIGWTWYDPAWQRTGVNTECKLLLLTHAFGTLGMRRVELKTDVKNEKSRAAIRRIGGTEEGIFRKHGISNTGRIRDTVYYSILDDEWPGVKQKLAGKLEGWKVG